MSDGLTPRPVRRVRHRIYFGLASLLILLVGSSLLTLYLTTGRMADHAERSAAAQIARAIAAQRHTGRLDEEEALRLCHQVLANPAILAARMWNGDGELLADAAANPPLLAHLAARPAERLKEVVVDRVESSGAAAGSGSIMRVSFPLNPAARDAAVVMMGLLVSLKESDFAVPGTWLCYLTLLVVGGAAGWFGYRHVRDHVAGPLVVLAGWESLAGADQAGAILAERGDEWGSIATGLVECERAASIWRDRASQVERRMETALAHQTRQITQDLQRMRREAWIDPLTGVKNRRLMEEKLPQIFSAQRAAGHDLSLVMLDLDHFKELNDAHGHPMGDEVLIFLGSLLQQCLRRDDIAVRYGGDEFALVLPGVGIQEADHLARRIMAMFAQRTRMMTQMRPTPTLSAGIASIRHNQPASAASLVALADRALYRAKHSGKARSEVCAASVVATGL